MRLSNKHANAQIVTLSDFSGGLNTTDAPETIQPNELSRAVNVEIYKGQLRTVAGNTRVYYEENGHFTDLIYDSIGKTILLTDIDHKVYALDFEEKTFVGTLTGTESVSYAEWEDGVLIASGGKLQYFHNGTLDTLSNSPDVCHGVFIKQGRVWVFYDDILKCSRVGDENDWENDTDDESSAQWLQIGYKDGGFIVGVTSLSSDIVILKNNAHAYHLAGDYPNWVLKEIGRRIECKCYNACVALMNNVVTLGNTRVQAISVTEAYGDMLAQDIATKVYGDISAFPSFIKMRYIPQLNQIWFIKGEESFLFYDVNINAWYSRRYNGAILDAVEGDNVVYLLKANGLYKMDYTTCLDDGLDMPWRFATKVMVSKNKYLIKRVFVDTTPYKIDKHNKYAGETFTVGRVNVNTVNSYKPANIISTDSIEIYKSPEYIFESDIPLKSLDMYRTETRCCDNEKAIPIRGIGGGNITVFNNISFEVAEV